MHRNSKIIKLEFDETFSRTTNIAKAPQFVIRKSR